MCTKDTHLRIPKREELIEAFVNAEWPTPMAEYFCQPVIDGWKQQLTVEQAIRLLHEKALTYTATMDDVREQRHKIFGKFIPEYFIALRLEEEVFPFYQSLHGSTMKHYNIKMLELTE